LKALLKTIIFFLLLLIVAYFSANFVLRKLALKAVATLQPRLEQKGILIDKFDYSTVRMNSFNSFAISDIDLQFHLNRKMYGKESFKADFDAQSLTVRFADLKEPSFFFTVKNFSLFIQAEEQTEKKTFGKFENGYLITRLPLYLKSPEESGREILKEIKTLFKESKTSVDLDVRSDVLLGIDDKEIKVGLYTVREDSVTYLRFDSEDIVAAAAEFDLDLAEKEAEIIAQYPSKVPSMIKISRDAKKYSKNEKSKNISFPEDAFRHIYWSYNLTREFGPELAQQITDAHETAPGNTKKERAMDYHNNEVARKYADQVLSVDELKYLVLNSDEIIRFPNEVQ
jgi:hypothetical protein